MKSTPSFKRVLLGTALVLPVGFALPAHAQEQTDAEQACAELNILIEEENLEGVDINEEEIRSIIDAEIDEQCRAQLDEVVQAVGWSAEQVDALSERVRASATEQETVVVEQAVVVEGQVFVDQQPPSVDIQQQGAEVAVLSAQPQVVVTEGQPEIVIREKQARVQVEIPQPTIRIEQPAPDIIITMPAPGVDVALAQPQVEVVQVEPVVTVTQSPPIFDLELQPAMDPDASEGIQITDRETGEPLPQDAGAVEAQQLDDAEVTMSQAEPVISFEESQEQAQVSITRAEPQVRFEQTEPQVEVMQQGEPTIQFARSGEPTVTIEQGEGESQQAAIDIDVDEVETQEMAAEVEEAAQETEQATEEMAAEVEQTTEEAVAQTEEAVEEEQVAMTETTAETGALMVGDITGQDVFNEAGEDLGDLERVIRLDGQTWAVISAGGFLGIGDREIPIELSRLAFSPEGQIVIVGLTREQIEAAQDVNLEGAEEVPADAELETAN